MTQLLEWIYEHSLTIDFGMFLIIWLVQVIIYPSLRFVDPSVFIQWHGNYCNRVAYFVLPLMILQLVGSLSTCFFQGSKFDWMRLIAVVFAWFITFFHSAPAHRKLAKGGKKMATIDTLIRGNLYRLVAWTTAFMISLYTY